MPMRVKRSAGVLVLAFSLILLLSLPGGGLSAAQERPEALTGPSDGAPADIAASYLRAAAADFDVSAADLAELGALSVVPSKHNGATHVNVRQMHKGLDIFGSVATVTVTADGRVASAGGPLTADVANASGSVQTDAVDAVEAAADGLDLDEPEDLEVLPSTASEPGVTVVSGGGISDAPIPARLGWQPTDQGLRLAWQVVIDDSSDVHLWNAAVDAETGELLDVDNWTISHSEEDLAHLARAEGSSTGSPYTWEETHVPPTRAVDGSSYRVYPLPLDSPLDGVDRPLVSNPADALSSPFGWHDTDGVPGPEFTITRGNNVHAYLDQDANNQPDPGQDVDGGPSLTFDHPIDHSEHAQAYRDAVVTNLFYWNNIVHDVMYRYGFDEVAGNFQANKYGATLPNGNPVPGGDYVRAEAADGGGTNNANFSTPANYGGTPRMQMYLWPGNQHGAQNQITVGDASFNAGWARFGPPASNAGVSGPLVIAANNGCNASDYPEGSDYVAITVNVTSGGGSCTNVVRSRTAEQAGAAAVIIASTTGTTTGAGPILTGAQTLPLVGIPAVSVTLPNGNALRDLEGQTATVRKHPNHPGIRDGDLDNAIILHEYGHGISLRQTGGPGINCLNNVEQMGEGWSDYFGLVFLIDPQLDDPEKARGLVPYSLFQEDRHGAGLRPRPYSRNMEIQPFTHQRIGTGQWLNESSLSQPHGIGHGWNAILWDMTWDLIERHGFNPNLYDPWDKGGNNLAIQLVNDGLKIQGCQPGFERGRDAILIADDILTGDGAENPGSGENNCLIWSSFARRGLGHDAVGGSSNNRNDNVDGFRVPPWCQAPGQGFVGPQLANAPALNTRTAGDVAPIFFNIAGHPKNGSLDALKPAHSPASQQIDCTTLEPTQYAITTPTDGPGNTQLMYNRQQNRYHYNWLTSADWAGTCRQLIITLEDGRQHRANFRFTAP